MQDLCLLWFFRLCKRMGVPPCIASHNPELSEVTTITKTQLLLSWGTNVEMDTTILVIIITRKAEFRNLHRRFEELNYGIFSGLPPFAPNNTTKALLLQRKPYCQNESRAIVLLCTQRGKWVHPSYMVFQQDSTAKMKMMGQGCKTANFRLHMPFCIRILQEQKGKD